MLCEHVYHSALALLGESMNANDNSDYEERASYLLAAFCSEVQERDKNWRRSLNLGKQDSWETLCIALDEFFPLSEKFACAAAFYVAAMLVVDSDEELSDKLYDRFCDAMSTIDSDIEAVLDIENDTEETPIYTLESIKNIYF